MILAELSEEDAVRLIDLEERQRLKQVEDEILDLQMIFDSTLDTIDCLVQIYETTKRCVVADSSVEVDNDSPDLVLTALKDRRRDAQLYMSKARTLRAKVQSTSQLVKITLSPSDPLTNAYYHRSQMSSILEMVTH